MKRKSWGAHQVKCLKSFPAWRILHRKFVPLLFTLPLISSMRYIKISLNLLGNAIILRNNGFICFQLLTKLDSKNYNCKFCLLELLYKRNYTKLYKNYYTNLYKSRFLYIRFNFSMRHPQIR